MKHETRKGNICSTLPMLVWLENRKVIRTPMTSVHLVLRWPEVDAREGAAGQARRHPRHRQPQALPEADGDVSNGRR